MEDNFLSKVKDDTEENSFATRQYVKAINCLVRPDMVNNNKHTCKSARLALTTCILFICFEVGVVIPNVVVFYLLHAD